MRPLTIKKFQETEEYTMYEVDGFLKVEERKGVFRVMEQTNDGHDCVCVTKGSASIEDAVKDFIMHYAAQRALKAQKFLKFWHRHMGDYVEDAFNRFRLFTDEEALDIMQGLNEAFDQENAHIYADEMLTHVLSHKYKEDALVKAYKDVDKWYA